MKLNFYHLENIFLFNFSYWPIQTKSVRFFWYIPYQMVGNSGFLPLFQEAITHLQQLEEELIEGHRSTIVRMQQWTKDDLALLNMTNEVDYDQDGK